MTIFGLHFPLRCDHAALAFGDKIFISSGCGGEGLYYNDIHILDTGKNIFFS